MFVSDDVNIHKVKKFNLPFKFGIVELLADSAGDCRNGRFVIVNAGTVAAAASAAYAVSSSRHHENLNVSLYLYLCVCDLRCDWY